MNTHAPVSIANAAGVTICSSPVTDTPPPDSTLARYVRYQIPGWLLASIGAVVLYRWVGIPVWVAVAIPVGWAVKDAALYPFLKPAYVLDHGTVIERLVGLEGVAVEPLSPRGYVRVRGELWIAEPVAMGPGIEVGHRVRVERIRGTTLLVDHLPSG